MPRRTPDPLADELAALLAELDAAIAARFSESRSQATHRRREETAHSRTPLHGVMAAARRWLRRARPGREDSQV